MHFRHLKEMGAKDFACFNWIRLEAWARARRVRGSYHVLREEDLSARLKSETVFIFGSGYSLNELAAAEWDHFRGHDTLGLNWFVYQRWIPLGYHYVREVGNPEQRFSREGWLDHVRRFSEEVNSSSLFKETVFFIQHDFVGLVGNMLVGCRLLRPGQTIFLYNGYRGGNLPTRSLRAGIPRAEGAIGGAINLAYLIGWKHIVLVGVDLYDTRYFWLKENESREGKPVDVPHPSVGRGIMDRVGNWREALEAQGVRVMVYNPRSLLAETLPVYQSPAIAERHS